MHRGYTITSPDLTQVLCFRDDHQRMTFEPVTSVKTLNGALCVPDLTEAKNILRRLKETEGYTELLSDSEVHNIARLYNKFF